MTRQPRQGWTSEEVGYAVAELGRRRKWREIAADMTVRFGRPFSKTAVRLKVGGFRPAHAPAPSRSSVAVAADPVAVDVDLSELEDVSPTLRSSRPPSEPPPTESAPPEAQRVPVVRPALDPQPAAAQVARDVREHRTREQLREAEAARKRLLEELRDRDAQLDILRELRRVPPTPIEAPRSPRAGDRRVGTPVMILSDWHVEEPVAPEKVNGLNEYNLEIAANCIAKCADAFEWFIADSRYDCRTAIVALLGDLLSGYIHAELVEANFLSPTQAIVWLMPHVESMLRRMLATSTCERILVVCTDGNHGRLTDRIRVATRTANSIEWLMYKQLAARFADEPRLEFRIAEGEWEFVDVYDQTIGFTHGDTFRYQGGVGGLLIPLRRGFNEMRKYHTRLSHMVCGHFHQRTDTGEITVNGSMIGINAYSMHLHATPEPRQQSWFMVDSVRGKCISAPVWL